MLRLLSYEAKGIKRAKTRDLGGEDQAEEESEVQPKKRKAIKVERISTFRGFNLKELQIPKEAWPLKDKEYNGKKGYTIVGSNHAVTRN